MTEAGTATRRESAFAVNSWLPPNWSTSRSPRYSAGAWLGGHLDLRRAELALADLVDLPLQRAPHRELLTRCWGLRSNLTVFDVAYVALAEALDSDLLTGDARLAKAPGPRCHIEILR